MDSSEFDAVDAETRQVMQSRVNTSVRHNYETQNVKFIVWLYDQGEHYIEILKPGQTVSTSGDGRTARTMGCHQTSSGSAGGDGHDRRRAPPSCWAGRIPS